MLELTYKFDVDYFVKEIVNHENNFFGAEMDHLHMSNIKESVEAFLRDCHTVGMYYYLNFFEDKSAQWFATPVIVRKINYKVGEHERSVLMYNGSYLNPTKIILDFKDGFKQLDLNL